MPMGNFKAICQSLSIYSFVTFLNDNLPDSLKPKFSEAPSLGTKNALMTVRSARTAFITGQGPTGIIILRQKTQPSTKLLTAGNSHSSICIYHDMDGIAAAGQIRPLYANLCAVRQLANAALCFN